MNEALKKINTLMKKFNDTFEIEANIVSDENGEEVASGLKIANLKNDGNEYINELFSMFGSIIESVSKDHELIYMPDKGLVIAKKVIREVMDYEVEEDDD